MCLSRTAGGVLQDVAVLGSAADKPVRLRLFGVGSGTLGNSRWTPLGTWSRDFAQAPRPLAKTRVVASHGAPETQPRHPCTATGAHAADDVSADGAQTEHTPPVINRAVPTLPSSCEGASGVMALPDLRLQGRRCCAPSSGACAQYRWERRWG